MSTQQTVRHIVVTGAGSGIGLACATHFVDAGWSVTFNVFDTGNQSDARARIDELERARPGSAQRCQVVQGDVSNDADCRRIAVNASEQFGRIDALVNAAGITRFCDENDLEGLSAADFQAIYAVNSIGTFQMARACANALKTSAETNSTSNSSRSTSAIVNLSSYAGVHGGGSSLAYGASKAAVNAITMSLARALAPQVRVNAICPALVAEGFVQRLQPESYVQRAARQIERTPLQRVGKPSEIAETVYWLVVGSPLITGEIIQLDAGQHLMAR